MKTMFGFILLLSFVITARAESPIEREVTLEIEEIEAAQSYDLEIKKITGGEAKQFSIARPLWVGRLAIGKYEMRNRSIDQRGVAGSWSKPEAFSVGLDKPKMIEPDAKVSLNSDEEGRLNMRWKWEPVEGAYSYAIEIKGSDGRFQVLQAVDGTTFEQSLPEAQRYTWKVIVQGPDSLSNSTEGEISIVADLLDKPVIQTPINSRAPQIKWTGPKNTISYNVKFERYEPKTRDWSLVAETQPSTNSPLIMDPAFQDGTYRVKIVAFADLEQPSPEASVTFKVLRAPAVLPAGPWAVRVSGGIDFDRYSASNNDIATSSPSNFHATGQSLQLGVTRLRAEEHWGFSFDGEMSKLKSDNGEQLNASAAQVSLLRRDSVGPRGELVSSLGARYKSLPISVTDLSGNISDSNVSALGLELGMSYSFKMTPFWGANAGVHFGEMLMSLKTPNDRAMDPTLCSQIDLSLSERWAHSFATAIGYRHRDDQMLYQSTSGMSNNVVSIRADSFNLTLEYDF
jgi:hypothetical protein